MIFFSYNFFLILAINATLTCLKENNFSPVYVKEIRKAYEKLYVTKETEKLSEGYNRTISARLDNLGFKELRGKDRIGAYFSISQGIWEIIISPICPELSLQQNLEINRHKHHNRHNNNNLYINNKINNKICDEDVMNGDEKKKANVTNVTIGDESLFEKYDDSSHDKTYFLRIRLLE